MRTGTVALLVGILALQQFPELPARAWCVLLPPLLLAAFLLPPVRAPLWVAVGFLWALLFAGAALDRRLPEALEGSDLVAEGSIASVPQQRARSTRFAFQIIRLLREGSAVPAPGRVRLSWYGQPPPLRAGDRWRLTVRMKRPSGFMNPGGFDYEGWLFHHGYAATGYVRADPANRRLGPPPFPALDRLRQHIALSVDQVLQGRPQRGTIKALAIGERGDVSPAHWEVLTRTGTSHLLAISGLHIGLVAGLVFFGVRRLWTLWPALSSWRPAVKAAALSAMGAALGYAALAGFSVPTRRALIMLAVGMGALVLQRGVRPSRVLALALAAILVLEPLSVLEAGFWLSFGAVAVLLYGVTGRVGPRGPWWRWGRAQWLVALGLLPLTLLFFQRASVVAPLANLVAVPWVSLLVVPAVLGGVALLGVSPAAGGWLLGLAERALGLLWQPLAWLAGQPFAQWTQPAPPAWALAFAVLGALLLLAPRGLPGRSLGALLLLPALLVRPPAPPPGTARLCQLDVGQGLAVVVRTHRHVLVYDTGARFSPRFDAGSAVVAPYLRSQGVRRIDRLVLTHGDNDHIGGLQGLTARTKVSDWLAGEPEAVRGVPARACRAGESWRWDGVSFSVLHPSPEDDGLHGNDRSCVLRVDAGGAAALLTGDIQAPVERRLLGRSPGALAADVLVAPHHGSNTSSTPGFVSAVRPRYVLFAVGYRNHYGFPRPRVVARYRALGARVLDSARHGALCLLLDSGQGVRDLRSYRREGRRYWNRN
ncbi:MAG: DNA internalization-related competence protein ComEC/Rec2 [Gammaproteobacteria bacterium]|nr:DNA internalization-related competence protein ComEC/Rec2 [Gammaproteobacteria bacterium]NIR99328.1 DNA internalization-related competence protein ComEC/Rec2 [Gammaproteobacteria bacterium]NIT64944.1 DNA internalization-related competence protein ComEC/Rec2 [Gammaproteobacteria bacterium]NIV21907.1 DNA internalization-related competence protein ComEC/Rec2 [Gammaproteobacteria bacterium]NIY33523.1 DNA internalization-related competence protein ComEC/Rec2 [Gammaproteobacteria bacterium]